MVKKVSYSTALKVVAFSIRLGSHPTALVAGGPQRRDT